MLTANDVLQFIASAYVGLAALVIVLVLIFAKGLKRKAGFALLALGLFAIWPVVSSLGAKREADEHRQRLKEATARFEERCKTAGQKIHRTVENVEGIQLINVRPKAVSSDRSNPNWADAALPNEGQGDEYVQTFLLWEHREDKRMPRGYLNNHPSPFPGYRYVDVRQADGQFSRYRLSESARQLVQESVQRSPARYIVGFTNVVDPDDRRMWIAGTKVTVTDAGSGEVIAESTWFSMDPGQGSTAGFRAPWGFARTCPELKGWVGAPTRFFVDTVLKPIKEE